MRDDIQAIGPRLRTARQAAALTLEELADSVGMSVSTLSRLESGKRGASLELLVPLTRRLGIRLDDLVRPETPDPRVRRDVEVREGLTIVPLTPEHAPVQTFKITFPVPQGEPALRVHDGFEWFYVLSGRIRLRLGEQDLTLAKGEAAEFDTRIPHSISASGGKQATVLSIFNASGERMHTHAAAEPLPASQ